MTGSSFAPQQFTAQLVDRQVYTDRFQQLRFEIVGNPSTLQFYPGQYVSIVVQKNGLRRSYSIVSDASMTHGFEILLEIIPNGIGSTYLKELQYGDSISFLAPLGRFTLQDNISNRATTAGIPATPVITAASVTAANPVSSAIPAAPTPLVFVATGSGIAPFKSMVHTALEQHRLHQQTANPDLHNQDTSSLDAVDALLQQQAGKHAPIIEKRTNPHVTLFWGMRHISDFFWLKEFQQLLQQYPDFSFHPTLSQPGPEWTLSRGRVTDILTLTTLDTSARYYLCGSRAMVSDTQSILIKKGIQKEQIFFELFS